MNSTRHSVLAVVLMFATFASAFSIFLVNYDMVSMERQTAATALVLEDNQQVDIDPSLLSDEPEVVDTSAFASESALHAGMPLMALETTGGTAVTTITTSHDKVPNFCRAATVVSVKDGAWSDPATWGGSVPAAGSIVNIKNGHTVTYDANSAAAIDCIGIDGVLTFSTQKSTKLVVGTMMVYGDGALMVGTEAAPIPAGLRADIVIADKPLNLTIDPSRFGTGLIGLGKVYMSGSPLSTSYVRLTRAPVPGDRTLNLENAPSGWKKGDTILIPKSTQDPAFASGNDEVIIESVSGSTITLNQATPIRYAHPGAVDQNNVLRFLPHVANLSRNVTISSQNPNGTRGHVWLTGRADIDIRYTQFTELGRTIGAELKSPNQVGRYPLHVHHVMGPVNTPANSYQFTLKGNVVTRNPVTAPINVKWAIVVHASHYGLVEDNIVYNASNSGITTEDGSESFNVIQKNMVVHVAGATIHYDASAGITLRGPNNYVRDNVVADMPGTRGFKILFGSPALTDVQIPKFKGADMSVAANTTALNTKRSPFLELSGNEIYGSGEGMRIEDTVSDTTGTLTGLPEKLVKNTKVWNNSLGIILNGVANITVDGLTAIKNGVAVNVDPGGDRGHNNPQKNITIKNADIHGGTGINLSSLFGNQGDKSAGTFLLEDSHIKAVTGLNIRQDAGWDAAFIPSTYTVRNVKFETVPPPSTSKTKSPATIAFGRAGSGLNRDFVTKASVIVKDYNKISGNDFKVYAVDQHPDFVIPQSAVSTSQRLGPKINGSPVAGETNAQNFLTRGIAVNGEVAPCTDRTTHPEVRGYTCPTGLVYSAESIAGLRSKMTVSPTFQAIWKPILFTATVEDPSKVSKVEFYTEDVTNNTFRMIGSDTEAPYELTKSMGGSNYKATARVYGKNGQVVNSSEVGFTVKGTVTAATPTGTTPTPATTTPATTTPAVIPPAIPRITLGRTANFDFGTVSSPLAAGFTRITKETKFSPTPGYGWTSGTIIDADRGAAIAGSDEVSRDFNYTKDGTFAVTIPNGAYTVTLMLGDIGNYRHDSVAVYLEDAKVDTVSTNAGQAVLKTYNVSVNDGQLTLRLQDTGGTDPNGVIEAMTVSLTALSEPKEPQQPVVDVPPTVPPPSGIISGEAENYTNMIARSGWSWVKNTAGTAVQALPNKGGTILQDKLSASPQLDYNVTFDHPGTYYLWVRGSGIEGTDDSFHFGLDGTWQPPTGSNIGFTGFTKTATWSWRRTEMTVPTAGNHVLNFWMREDGMVIDKYQISNSVTYIPQ